jgi:plastocyanin
LGILIIIGLIAAINSSGQTPTIFAYIGIIILISLPAIFVIAGIYRNSPKIKIYLSSFVVAVIIGIVSISAIGIQIQNQGSISAENNEQTMAPPEPISNININELSKVNILAGSSAQGNPDYDPDELIVKDSIGVIWVNQDNVPHTVTSLKDDGQSFDSSIIMGNANYTLLFSDLKEKEYEYFCTIHPYMTAKFKIE